MDTPSVAPLGADPRRLGRRRQRHAGCALVIDGFLRGGGGEVAGQASCIVGGGIGLQLFVRIVAGDAAYARIVCVVAFAVSNAIRLKPDIVNASEVTQEQ